VVAKHVRVLTLVGSPAVPGVLAHPMLVAALQTDNDMATVAICVTVLVTAIGSAQLPHPNRSGTAARK
jgi:hypothetical protein